MVVRIKFVLKHNPGINDYASVTGYWSRRINDEHRFVYKVSENSNSNCPTEISLLKHLTAPMGDVSVLLSGSDLTSLLKRKQTWKPGSTL